MVKLIQHEIIHRKQLYKSKVPLSSDIDDISDVDTKYLSNKSEVMLWASNCIDEFIMKNCPAKIIKEILRNPFRHLYASDSNALFTYTSNFDSDSLHLSCFEIFLFECCFINIYEHGDIISLYNSF